MSNVINFGSALIDRTAELSAKGEGKQALETAEHAVLVAPESATAWFNLGVCYHDRGRHEEAAEAYRFALNIEPDMKDAKINLNCLCSEDE